MTARTFQESLHELEHALAEAQYQATMASPFNKDSAAEHLQKLESVQKRLSDLHSFIKRQAR